MFCALSGAACEVPVVTPSGHIYESRIIKKHLATDSVDPISGEPLTENDLIVLKVAPTTDKNDDKVSTSRLITPRLTSHTSIPGLLSTLQNEWDSLMLETHSLKSQNLQLREELSLALYEVDAAKRVVARLVKERDAAKESLKNVKVQFAQAGATAVEPAEKSHSHAEKESSAAPAKDSPWPEDLLNEMTTLSQTLSQGRRKRKAPSTYTSSTSIAEFKELDDLNIPSTLIARHPSGILAGFNKKKIVVCDLETKQQIAQANLRLSKDEYPSALASIVQASGEKYVAIGTSAGSLTVYQVQEDSLKNQFKLKLGSAVSSISVHPTQSFVLASSNDSLSFVSLSSQSIIASTGSSDLLTTSAIHPDGMLFAAGVTTASDVQVRIYDIKSLEVVATFTHEQNGEGTKVSSIDFSENGYYVASSVSNSLTAKIWDLRKLTCAKEIDVSSEVEGANGVSKVSFDEFGTAIAVGVGASVCTYSVKPFKHLVTVKTGVSADINSLKWSLNGSHVYISSYNPTGEAVKVIGKNQNAMEED